MVTNDEWYVSRLISLQVRPSKVQAQLSLQSVPDPSPTPAPELDISVLPAETVLVINCLPRPSTMDDWLPDELARTVLSAYAALPKNGKPRQLSASQHSWTVLAGFGLINRADITCIALGHVQSFARDQTTPTL